MKPCNACGDPKPDEAFAKDATREDGLALICRECNKEKCKRWYKENKERKLAQTNAYKAEHGREPKSSGESVRKERARLKAQKEQETQSELKLIRLTESEWLFCLLQGQELGIKPEEYIRYLVKDAKFQTERSERNQN